MPADDKPSTGVMALAVALLVATGCGAGSAPASHPVTDPHFVPGDENDPGGIDDTTGATLYAPVMDTDGDTCPDVEDQCPDQAEDQDGFQDQDGCLDLDDDKDAIVDEADECPTEPETYNGVDDQDGCPDSTGLFVHICPTIDVPDVLHYEPGDPLVPDAWKPTLDLIAKVIIENPQILRVQVASHTDQQGTAGYNLKISQERADAVVAYLVSKGVASAVLSSAGYGETCPMNQGASASSFSTNKRVELRLLLTTSGCTDVPFTCKDAIDQGLVPAGDLDYLPGSEYCKNIPGSIE